MIHAIDTFLLIQTGRLLSWLRRRWSFSSWILAQRMILVGFAAYAVMLLLLMQFIPWANVIITLVVMSMGMTTIRFTRKIDDFKKSYESKDVLLKNRTSLDKLRMRPVMALMLTSCITAAFLVQHPEALYDVKVLLLGGATMGIFLVHLIAFCITSVELSSKEYDDAVVGK